MALAMGSGGMGCGVPRQEPGPLRCAAKRCRAPRRDATVVSNQPTREPMALGWGGWGSEEPPVVCGAQRGVATHCGAVRRGEPWGLHLAAAQVVSLPASGLSSRSVSRASAGAVLPGPMPQ